MDAASWDRAKDLIADALELPPAERDAFLRAHCSDQTLLEHIRDRIKAYEDAPGFLESPPASRDPDPLQPGSQVGPYVIVRRLGAGGMGQVFLSTDDRLERKVALKRLIPSNLDPTTARSRILSEARAAARINHPNIAAVHDVLEHGGRIFIVMEFVEGESLAAHLRREWLPLDRVLAIGRQLSAALVAAHAQGVVHRDLKPANIQITLDGSVKVLDFGIATAATPVSKLTTSTGAVLTPLGQVRGAAGTPEYMSPEQVQSYAVDARSDIFSLGLVLFEMVTGRRPFADMGLLDRRASPMMAVPRADALDPRVPRDVADVIAKAVAVDVKDRFQSASELEQALAALDRRRRSWRRWAAWAAGAALLLPLLGVISTAAFELTLQIPSRFATEPLYAYVVWGFRSNVGLIVIAIVAGAIVATVGFVLRVCRLLQPIDRVCKRVDVRDALVSRLDLDDPVTLAHALAGIGVLVVGGIFWRFFPLIQAYTSFIGQAPIERLLPLAPDDLAAVNERGLYRAFVDITLLVFSAIVVRILRLRAEQGARRGTAAVVIAMMVLTAVVLLHQVPYRIMYNNQFERIDFAGARCYLIGEAGGDGLIYCPDNEPPRNGVIQLDDPRVRRLGVSESIFTRRTR